ncbi:GNAT family N-acetyltransferase [uncultured Maribacter sp.]|uniref:GNAT family N-acetyltransferase n=1 Tax=uncultured Maribacter sp. TaxID=431308 RepID=UPI0026216F60|nr:GNAT family N-acetyltransferase [uncultured Maribacter sp.]
MEKAIKKDFKQAISHANTYCLQQGLEVVFTYEISQELINTISERSQATPTLYFASKEMIQQRLKNGCYLLIKDEEICGHIFAHRHEVRNHYVYERSSLWVHPEHRNNHLGLLLMNNLTQKHQENFLISIAQEPTVHRNNELLGMKHITLAEISPELIETLEEIGKLRDEYKYKYYVNPYFKRKLEQFKKIINRHNKS